MKRKRLDKEAGGNYFVKPKTNLSFIPSGCKLLDLALGGGWVESRIANVIGDKSTGKTLLMIEACANFARKYKNGQIWYRESEAAFDGQYAEALGLPMDRVDFSEGKPIETVEDFFEDLSACIKSTKGPALYILDSLDALSDRAELKRDMDEGTYGTMKARLLSQLFRRLVQQLNNKKVTVLIVSQVRENIGVMFGRKTTRSGGRALDFYASQIVYLAQMGTIEKTVRGQKRKVGIKIKAKLDKNKVSLPYREAEFSIRFGFGIDDAEACLDWLKSTKLTDEIDLPISKVENYRKELALMSDEEYADEVADMHDAIEEHWYQIEKKLIPIRRKYQ